MITNTNGLIDNIYHYFWLKDDSLLKESFNIKIPDTIIFKNGVASVWYFTSRDGEILTKKGESRKPENIVKNFTKNIKQEGHVVAYYIYPHKFNTPTPQEVNPFHTAFESKQVKFLDTTEKICIYYITKGMLLGFLESSTKSPEGILQKFIEPLGNHESLIQAIWSPSVCILSKKQNNRDLYDMSYDPYERCTTFDGGEAYSRVIPLRGKEISQEIRKQCQMIVQKITNLSYGQTNISRMIFYFKPDQNNKVWFLYCSSIRVSGEPAYQIKQYKCLWGNTNVKKNNTPIPFNTNYERPHQIKNMMTVNTMHPVKLNKDIECFECGLLCQQMDLYHLTYEFIIKHFEQDVNQNPIRNQIQVLPPKSFKQSEDYLRDIHSHIPPLILKLYPQLTVNLYEQLKINDAFLIKNILVCEGCFLKYSESNPSVSGAKNKIKEIARPMKRFQSACFLQKRPEIKEFLIETNQEMLSQHQKPLRIKTHFSSSHFGSFNSSHYSTNILSQKQKTSKQSLEIKLDWPIEPGTTKHPLSTKHIFHKSHSIQRLHTAK